MVARVLIVCSVWWLVARQVIAYFLCGLGGCWSACCQGVARQVIAKVF